MVVTTVSIDVLATAVLAASVILPIVALGYPAPLVCAAFLHVVGQCYGRIHVLPISRFSQLIVGQLHSVGRI